MKSVLHTTDIYSAVWPLHFVLRIFGLAPYSLKPTSQSAKYAIFLTFVRKMWSIFFIIFLVVWQYLCFTRTIIANVTLKQKVSVTSHVVTVCSYSIITLFQSPTVNGSKVREILRKFSEIDQLFSSKVYRSLIYKNTTLFLTLPLAIMISFIIILKIVNVILTVENFRLEIIFGFVLLLPMCMNITAILHFVNLVLLLRNKYKFLNFLLESSTPIQCNATQLNYRNKNCMALIQNYTFIMKLSLTEMRENCSSSRRQHFRNMRIIYNQFHDVAFLVNST
jgi:hypothetical protein